MIINDFVMNNYSCDLFNSKDVELKIENHHLSIFYKNIEKIKNKNNFFIISNNSYLSFIIFLFEYDKIGDKDVYRLSEGKSEIFKSIGYIDYNKLILLLNLYNL